MIINGRILVGMSNVSGKICRKNQNTHFLFKKLFFSRNRAVYEIIIIIIIIIMFLKG